MTGPGATEGAALDVAGLTVAYGPTTVLRDVSFSVGWGELVAVVGPNGAGKSSLFKAVCGLVPSVGSVAIGGAHCHHRRDRMGAAYLPQRSDIDPEFPITVEQLVAAGRRRFLRGWQRPGAVDREAVDVAIATVGLEGLAGRPIRTLSVGQLQRAVLARALAQEARLLLLDEALSGVDSPSTDQLLGLFGELVGRGTTVLVATHDLALARRRFSRCLAVNGRLVADGAPAEVLDGDALERTFGSASGAALPVAR